MQERLRRDVVGGGEMATGKTVLVGEVAQLAGVGAVLVGLVLSLHHWPAAAALLGGAAAFYVGKKLRGA